MNKIIAILALTLFAVACDPVENARECREAGGNTHECNFAAMGNMFIHPSWVD